jgi:prenyltransferase beta subunit
LLYTLSALQILALLDCLHLLGDKRLVAQYVAALQQPDGSFAGDQWGEHKMSIKSFMLNSSEAICCNVDSFNRCFGVFAFSHSVDLLWVRHYYHRVTHDYW